MRKYTVQSHNQPYDPTNKKLKTKTLVDTSNRMTSVACWYLVNYSYKTGHDLHKVVFAEQTDYRLHNM